MNPFNLQQDFNAELTLLRQLLPEPLPEPLELNFNTVFEDFLNETDTANEDIEFVIGQGLEDTITHIIQLDMFNNNPLNILNNININNYDIVVNNLYLEDRQPEEEDDLLQYILDYDELDVIPYDSPMEAEALFAD
jgi:hypothetical protein